MELLIEVLGYVGLLRFYGVVGYQNPSWNRVMSCFQNRLLVYFKRCCFKVCDQYLYMQEPIYKKNEGTRL